MKILTTRSKMDAKLLHAQGKKHDMDKFKNIVKRAYKEVSNEDSALAYMKKNGGEWASYLYNDFLDPDIKNNEVLKDPVSYTHLRAHETPEHLVCRLLLEKKKK